MRADEWTLGPLQFLDTAGASYDEQLEPDGDSRWNAREAAVVVRCVQGLLAAGVPAAEIGVISPYAAQVRHLRERLTSSGVEIDTVDGFQGLTWVPADTNALRAGKASANPVATKITPMTMRSDKVSSTVNK